MSRITGLQEIFEKLTHNTSTYVPKITLTRIARLLSMCNARTPSGVYIAYYMLNVTSGPKTIFRAPAGLVVD